MNILFVEDNPGDAKLLQVIFTSSAKAEFRIIHTERLGDALRLLSEKSFDVVLLDLTLPDSHGLGTLQQVQNKAPDVPIIVLTGFEDERTALQALQTGAQDYLIKGQIDYQLISRAIRYAVERKAAERALRDSEIRFRRLAENARDLIYRYRFYPDQGFEFVSPSATEITGYTPEEHYADPLLGLKIIFPEDLPLMEQVRKDPSQYAHPIILRWVRKDGKIIWTEQQNVPIYNNEHRLIAVEGVARDITDRKLVELELSEARSQLAQRVKELERYASELSLANEMLAQLQTCDQLEEAYQVIEEYASQLFSHLHGQLWMLEEKGGVFSVKVCFGRVACTSRKISVEDCLALQQKRTYLVKNIHESALCAHLESPKELLSGYLCVPIVNEDQLMGLFHFALGKDVSPTDEHWELAETTAKQIGLALTNINLRVRLRQQAIHDSLTGLFNRLYMEEILKHELFRLKRSKQPLSMLMLDIDHFKQFNDVYGHLAGDEVLRELGKTLMKFVRASDVACRYGGEEFLLILPEVSLETAAVRAEELRQTVSNLTVEFNGKELGKLTISIGVAAYPIHGLDGETVIQAADEALYQAKQQGRNRVVVAPFPANE